MRIPRSHIALIVSSALVLSVVGAFGLHSALAGPTAAPPGNNVAAPLNQGGDPQRKSGTLRLGSSNKNETVLTVDSSPTVVALSVLGSLLVNGINSTASVSAPLFCLTDDKCIRRWADGGGVSVPSSGSTTGLGWKVVGNGWEEVNGAISSTPLACEVSHWGGTGDNKASCDGNKYIVCPGTSDTPKTGAKVWLNQERVPTVRQHYLCLQKDSGTSATGTGGWETVFGSNNSSGDTAFNAGGFAFASRTGSNSFDHGYEYRLVVRIPHTNPNGEIVQDYYCSGYGYSSNRSLSCFAPIAAYSGSGSTWTLTQGVASVFASPLGGEGTIYRVGGIAEGSTNLGGRKVLLIRRPRPAP